MGAVMTPAHCDAQLKRLRVLKGLPEDVVEYFSALEDVPDERFTLAVSHALKTRHWFPTPAELRADCDAVAAPAPPAREEARIEALVGGGREVVIVNPLNPSQQIRVKVHRVWKFDCLDCVDSGWRSHQCPSEPCGRRFDHAPHEWVERCACIDWNPTIRRHKEANAKYAKEPSKVGA
jgi:hypothetical protein